MTYGPDEYEQHEMDRGRDRDDEEREAFRTDLAAFDEDEWDARREAETWSGFDGDTF